MVYKYKVGKKWFTFDKSVLQPEDLQIFDKADWTDKLKIITIYNDLKETDDDTVNVLSFKKENANKDKRKMEYNAKREKLMNNIKELNESDSLKSEKEIKKLQKELNDLDIEYADVVNINTANTLNVSNVNTLNLRNIDKIKSSVEETEKKFEEVKNLLSADDIQNISKVINDIKSSNDVGALKDAIKGLKKEDLPEELIKSFDDINTKIENLSTEIGSLKDIMNSRNLATIIKAFRNIDTKDISDKMYNDIDNEWNLEEVMKFYEEYSVKRKNIYYVPSSNQYIPVDFKLLKVRFAPFSTGVNTTNDFYYLDEEDNEYKKFKDMSVDVPNNFNIITREIKSDVYKNFSCPLFEILYSIYKNHNKNIKTTSEEKGEGFLGLKTNKEAKKDLEGVFKLIRDLQSEFNQFKDEVKEELRNIKNETKKPNQIPYQQQETNALRPKNIQPKKETKFPIDKSFEDSLKEIMTRRRRDIEPEEYTDESEEWGNGVRYSPNEVRQGSGIDDMSEDDYTDDSYDAFGNEVDEDYHREYISDNVGTVYGGKIDKKIQLAGSLLEELKEDLKNYGLALNFSVYKKRRKNPEKRSFERSEGRTKEVAKGNGIVEAKKINDSIDQNTNYTDLKELYEDLYDE